MNEINIIIDMRVSLIKDHLKVKAGESGVVKAKRFINNEFLYEIIFDSGVKCFCKVDILEKEGFTKAEVLSIPILQRSTSERASFIANRVIDENKIMNKLDKLSQSETELKFQLKNLQKERSSLKTTVRKIEESSRRLTKIKALSDNAIVVQIEEDIKF
jgi:hypothetical protein